MVKSSAINPKLCSRLLLDFVKCKFFFFHTIVLFQYIFSLKVLNLKNFAPGMKRTNSSYYCLALTQKFCAKFTQLRLKLTFPRDRYYPIRAIYRYARTRRVWLYSRFDRKYRGIKFGYFGLKQTDRIWILQSSLQLGMFLLKEPLFYHY